MRSLRKNMSKLMYSLYEEEKPVYVKDSDGNILYDDVDGEQVPRIDGYLNGYSEPVEFFGSIAFAGSASEAAVYGVSIESYDARLVAPHGTLPISETTLVFQTSEPKYNDDGTLVETSADFRCVRVADSINDTVYLLKRIVHNG